MGSDVAVRPRCMMLPRDGDLLESLVCELRGLLGHVEEHSTPLASGDDELFQIFAGGCVLVDLAVDVVAALDDRGEAVEDVFACIADDDEVVDADFDGALVAREVGEQVREGAGDLDDVALAGGCDADGVVLAFLLETEELLDGLGEAELVVVATKVFLDMWYGVRKMDFQKRYFLCV